jgi:hypothetical protein
VKPGLDENHSNGVSTLDLIHVQKHLLGLDAIQSPYKMIAADVNRDDKISASDLLDSRELILGVTDKYKNNTSWRFIRADYEFTNEANPLTDDYPEFENIQNIQEDKEIDFIAIKIGDITNDASLDGKPAIEGRNYETLNMEVESIAFDAGETVKVPVFASAFNQINGFQFTLNYDQSLLDFSNIEAGALNMGAANYYNNDRGALTVSWSTAIAVDVEDDAVLFTLTFNAGKKAELSESIQLGSAITKAEAYDANLEKLDLELNFRNLDLDELDYVLYQNTPNPFSDNTVIRFNMKKAGFAAITIFDLNGRVIRTIEGEYNKGIQEITLHKNELPVNGMMYYQMNTNDFTATRKMILVK